MANQVFKVSDCPVCSTSGAVVVLRVRGQDKFVFHCPMCGCAWRVPPDPGLVDSVESLKEVAPEGVELPDRASIASTFAGTKLVEADEWLEYLDV